VKKVMVWSQPHSPEPIESLAWHAGSIVALICLIAPDLPVWPGHQVTKQLARKNVEIDSSSAVSTMVTESIAQVCIRLRCAAGS
jgi:hypothetical protein